MLLKSACETVGRVAAAAGVAKERLKTVGRVFVATGHVVIERFTTDGCVGAAGRVAKEGERSIGRVVVRRWCCLKALQRQWRYSRLRY